MEEGDPTEMSQLSFIVLSEREGLERALAASGHVSVLERVSEPQDLVELVKRRRPDGLLADLGAEPAAVLAEIEKISAPRPQLIVAGPSESELILHAMRLGAREYVAETGDAEAQLQRAVERLVLEARPVAPRSTTHGPVIVLLGSKGGVGATFVACQLAGALARGRSAVALVDLNLRLGDVALYLDLQPRYTLANLAADRNAIDSSYLRTLLTQHSSGVSVIAAPSRPEEADLVDGENVERALSVLRQEFDWVIVDASTFFDEPTLRALDFADQILLITSPDVPTLAHTREHLDLLERLGHPPGKIRVVVNREGRTAPVRGGDVGSFLKRKLDLRLPSDLSATVTCVNEGRSLSSVAPRSPLSKAVDDLARLLHEWNEIPLPEPTRAGGLRKLFRRSRRGAA